MFVTVGRVFCHACTSMKILWQNQDSYTCVVEEVFHDITKIIIMEVYFFCSAGNRDAQTHAQIKIIANKTPPGLLLVGGTRCFGKAMDWWLLVEGEYKLYHSVWEPPIMCVAWKISRSLGCYVDNESIPLKILFISISKPSSGTSTNPCFPLRRAYLFTFMLSHHLLIKKHR